MAEDAGNRASEAESALQKQEVEVKQLRESVAAADARCVDAARQHAEELADANKELHTTVQRMQQTSDQRAAAVQKELDNAKADLDAATKRHADELARAQEEATRAADARVAEATAAAARRHEQETAAAALSGDERVTELQRSHEAEVKRLEEAHKRELERERERRADAVKEEREKAAAGVAAALAAAQLRWEAEKTLLSDAQQGLHQSALKSCIKEVGVVVWCGESSRCLWAVSLTAAGCVVLGLVAVRAVCAGGGCGCGDERAAPEGTVGHA